MITLPPTVRSEPVADLRGASQVGLADLAQDRYLRVELQAGQEQDALAFDHRQAQYLQAIRDTVRLDARIYDRWRWHLDHHPARVMPVRREPDPVTPQMAAQPDWLALPMFTGDMLANVLPGLALLLGWSSGEYQAFRRLADTPIPAAVANPLAHILTMVAAAKTFQEAGVVPPAPQSPLAKAVQAAIAALQGPVWIGMVAGILAAMSGKKVEAWLNDADLYKVVTDLIADAAPPEANQSLY